MAVKSSSDQVTEQKVCKHEGAVVLYMNECPLCAQKGPSSDREAVLEKELATAKARISKLQSLTKDSSKSKDELANYKKLADKYAEENSELEAKIKELEKSAEILHEFGALFSRLVSLEQKPDSQTNVPVKEELKEDPKPVEAAPPIKDDSEDAAKFHSEVQEQELVEEKDVQVVPLKAEPVAPKPPLQAVHVRLASAPQEPTKQSEIDKSPAEATGLPSLEAALQQYKAINEKSGVSESLKNKRKGN